MTLDRDDRGTRDAPPEPEEIEILEVEGMEEPGPDAGTDEIVVDFDDAAPPARRPEEPREEQAARERLLRLQADFENLRKRIEREQAEFRAVATIRLVRELLPVLDNFERALASERPEGESAAFRAGVELIHRQLLEALRKEGLRPVDALGRPFDPEVHEAVAVEPATGLPDHTVIEEIQRGYFLRERLLRPALVKVGTGGGPGDGGAGSGEGR